MPCCAPIGRLPQPARPAGPAHVRIGEVEIGEIVVVVDPDLPPGVAAIARMEEAATRHRDPAIPRARESHCPIGQNVAVVREALRRAFRIPGVGPGQLRPGLAAVGGVEKLLWLETGTRLA